MSQIFCEFIISPKYLFHYFTEEGLEPLEARKKTVQMVPFSRNTVHKVLKEKKIFGNVLGGAMPHSRLSRFDKLSSEQKEAIRKIVSFNIETIS